MTASSSKLLGVKAIKDALIGGYPVIALETWEEDLSIATLRGLVNSVFQGKGSFYTWDLQKGLENHGTKILANCDQITALDKILEQQSPGFFVFKDLETDLTPPEIQRRLRSLHYAFRGQNRFLFLLGTTFNIPPELKKDILLIRNDLPNLEEIGQLVSAHFNSLKAKEIENQLSDEQTRAAINSLKGFTTAEAKYALNKATWGKKVINQEFLDIIQNEKEQLARKEGVLEFVKTADSLTDVGGLENLKEWLIKRKKLFTPEAAAAGIRAPRGLLMMGISGCGKSLSVKAISSLWGLPLFRLDMNKVYSGVYGSPEGTFHKAIQSIEAASPAILWIDEIEGGISSSTAKDGSTGSHIFSAFLTWMQEKSSDVFVAATANRIDLLPAEIIRKGRFDQVFFIDLPNDHERECIFKVHLSRRGNDISQFDLPLLSVATEFWNGAEIEHVVEAAMVEAFSRDEQMTQDDLYTIIRSTVPLSRTMSEQIKFIKNWANERAVSASKPQEEE